MLKVTALEIDCFKILTYQARFASRNTCAEMVGTPYCLYFA